MSTLLSPFIIFWVLIIFSFIFYRLHKYGFCRICAGAALVELFLFSSTPLPAVMVYDLETRYPVFNNKYVSNVNILVLGSGHSRGAGLTDVHKLSPNALARLAEGIRLYHKFPQCKMVLSGYPGSDTVSQAVVSSRAALLLGVKPVDTLLLPKPSTTREEAIAYRNRFDSADKFLLVTTALHMPRAIEAFTTQGLRPVAAPANLINSFDKPEFSWTPSVKKLEMSEKAIYEYAGILYYRMFAEKKLNY